MYLQKLEIQGFKSFAHKTTLEFNRQLTAIVGPNGSGKSNIADAVRWVLGEQSLKLLRGKRAEDVIFAGSDLKSRLGMAEVSLHLNNEDGDAPVDYSEIVITRRVFRDGQSEYLLNGAPVRLQDIQLLLAQANFGQKTYSVIGQGMVDSILLSSPAERKEFFEEATGVKQYQLKREQSIAKLLATFDNLDQAQALLREIEPRLRSLTRQVKRLERREELVREVLEVQKVYYRFRWHNLEAQRVKISQQAAETDKTLQKQRLAAEELQAKLNELEQAGAVSVDWQSWERQQVDLRQQVTDLLRRQALEQARIQAGQLKKGQVEQVFLQQRQNELADDLKEISERLAVVAEQIKKYQDILASALAEQTNLTSGLSSLQVGGYSWLEEELKAVLEEQKELRVALMAAVNLNQVKEIVTKFNYLEEKIQSLLTKLKQVGQVSVSDWERLMKEREAAVQTIAEAKAQLKSLTREQTELKNKHDKLAAALLRIKRDLGETTEIQTKVDNEIAIELAEAESKLKEVTSRLAKLQADAQERQVEVFKIQRQLSNVQQIERQLEQTAHQNALELTKLETKLEDLDKEMAKEVPPEMIYAIKEPGEVQLINEGDVALELQRLKHQLELTGGIEPEVLTEYQQTKTRYDFLSNQIADLQAAVSSLETIIRDLDATIEKKFLASFKEINEKFGQYFKVLFGGGKASLILQRTAEEAKATAEVELELAEEGEIKTSDDSPAVSAKDKFLAAEKLRASLFSGVEISATPPGKKLSSITALSGGEKALTSIALICAIISYNPSPFVILDEVDAALDEANSERYAAILDSLMDRTQFITITHNRATMRRASILYGVTMGEDGVSKLLSVKFDEADELAAKTSKGKEQGVDKAE